MNPDKPPFISEISPQGILSFGPNTPSLKLSSLSVLIGPNGSGKSNFIELFELLSSAPTDIAATIRDGGGVREWLWKGDLHSATARIGMILKLPSVAQQLRHELELGSASDRLEILDEKLEDEKERVLGAKDVYFYYRFQKGHPVINVRTGGKRRLAKSSAEFLRLENGGSAGMHRFANPNLRISRPTG